MSDLKIVDGFIAFANKIYSKSGQGEDKNFIFSPLNLSLGLSLILAGAKKSSESELKHLLDYVHVSSAEIHKNNAKLIEHIKNFKAESVFKFANRLYIRSDVTTNKEYLDFVQNNYKTGTVKSIDFANQAGAAKEINDWVEAELNTKLHKHIVEALINGEYKMLLVNGLFFKGKWFKKFDKHLTKRDDFHLQDGSVVQVTMMQLTNRKFKYKESAAGLSASICEFPYVGQELSMSIILPNKDSSLAEVESQLTSETLRDALEEYNFSVKVNVHVPQFRIEESSEFSEVLKNLDAPHLFNGIRVDYSGIAPSTQHIHLSRVFNKLVVEVDEEGMESSEASGSGKTTWNTASAIGQRAADFNCNRPFLFIIHDVQNRLPLIMGKFARPDTL